MHPHLHTEEVQKSIIPPTPTTNPLANIHPSPGCAEVVAALEECHAQGFLHKVTGNCTDAKYRVNMCLRGLRLERTRQNREQAREKRAQIKKVWAELDEGKYTERERAERAGQVGGSGSGGAAAGEGV